MANSIRCSRPGLAAQAQHTAMLESANLGLSRELARVRDERQQLEAQLCLAAQRRAELEAQLKQAAAPGLDQGWGAQAPAVRAAAAAHGRAEVQCLVCRMHVRPERLGEHCRTCLLTLIDYAVKQSLGEPGGTEAGPGAGGGAGAAGAGCADQVVGGMHAVLASRSRASPPS